MQSASNWEARDRATAAARERFVAGSDCGEVAVRPEILLSWHRCRDEYKIDPGQSRAPSADDYCDHSLKNDRVVTELGSVGRSLLEDVEALGGLVAITDGAARILTAWGDRQALRHGEQSNLAPWSAWSERATGTNGMGTALEYSGEILVSRCEHWCEGLQDWSCAGTTIRDPVTGQALGVLDVSSWRKPLPDTVLPWLRSAVEGVRAELREQARHDMSDLEAALKGRGRRAPSSVFALDAGGGVVAVSNKGTAPGGTSFLTITVDCPALREFVRKGVTRARADHSWVGYVECFIPHVGDVVPFTIRPVVKNNRVIGALGTLGESAGEHLSLEARSTESSNGLPQRVAAVEGNRLIILHPQQIIFAEAERNSVWLTTDRGRIRARERGLERLVGQLHDSGFIRVHRHFAVNARRVREIKHGFRGQLSLVMDPGARKTVPVSRRREATVRRALELLLCSHLCGLSVAAFLGSAVGRTIGRVRSRARGGLAGAEGEGVVFAGGHAFAPGRRLGRAGVDLVFGESCEPVAAPFAADGHMPWVRQAARNPGHLGSGKPGSRGSACSYPTPAVQVSGFGSSAAVSLLLAVRRASWSDSSPQMKSTRACASS
jgi:hypothetical protein